MGESDAGAGCDVSDDGWDQDAYGDEDGITEETKDQILINSLGLKNDYLKQPVGVSQRIAAYKIALELQQLEVNKEDYGVESVHFHPEFGFLFIKIDPRSFNISEEHASFIDLKLDRTINLELKFNI